MTYYNGARVLLSASAILVASYEEGRRGPLGSFSEEAIILDVPIFLTDFLRNAECSNIDPNFRDQPRILCLCTSASI